MTRHGVAGVLAALVLACSPRELAQLIEAPVQPSEEVWLVQSTVQGPQGRTSYVQLLGSLEAREVDTSRALEIAGNGRVFAQGRDLVFLGSTESTTVTRYAPREDGALVAAEKVSFASAGFGFLPYGNTFASDGGALLAEGTALTAVQWSPQDKAVGRRVDLSSLARAGLELGVDPGVSRGQTLFLPLQYTSPDRLTVFRGVAVAVVDLSAVEPIEVLTDDRCIGGYSGLSLAEDGTVYVSGDGYSGLTRLLDEMSPSTCLLRIRPGERQFDAAWSLEWPSVLGGRDGTGFVYAGNGIGFVPALDRARIPSDVRSNLLATFDIAAVQWWRVDLTQRSAKALEVPFHALGNAVGFVRKGRVFLGVPDKGQRGKTPLVEVDPMTGAVTPRITVPGLLSSMHDVAAR
jgi:hypothetical protein